MLAKILIVILGVIGVFFLTDFLFDLLPPLPLTVSVIARLVVLILSTWIIMQIAGRIEKEIDRKP